MPPRGLQKQRLPPFARLRTVPAMTAVTMVLAEMLRELKGIEGAKRAAAQGNEAAMGSIAIGALSIAVKCDEARRKLKALSADLDKYRKQLESVTTVHGSGQRDGETWL